MAEMATIKVNSRTLGIHAATGEVMDARKWAVTEVSGGGGSGAVYGANGTVYGGSHTSPITSKTTNHTELFIRSKDGKERVVKLKDEDINVRTGSWVTLLWAIPEGKDGGDYVAILNHDTDKLEFIASGVKEACSSAVTMLAATLTFILTALGLLILFTAHSVAAWLLIAAFPGFLFWRSRLRRTFMTDVRALRDRIDGSRPAVASAT